MKLAQCKLVYIVQDIYSGAFLMPECGDVGFTNQFAFAGHFIDIESAYITGADYFDDFKVHRIWLELDAPLNTN